DALTGIARIDLAQHVATDQTVVPADLDANRIRVVEDVRAADVCDARIDDDRLRCRQAGATEGVRSEVEVAQGDARRPEPVRAGLCPDAVHESFDAPAGDGDVVHASGHRDTDGLCVEGAWAVEAVSAQIQSDVTGP